MPETVNLQTVNTWGQVFVNSFQQAFSQIIALAPRVLAALALSFGASLIAALVNAVFGGMTRGYGYTVRFAIRSRTWTWILNSPAGNPVRGTAYP